MSDENGREWNMTVNKDGVRWDASEQQHHPRCDSRDAQTCPCYAPRHTIRAEGLRRHARPGERVQLYTGMRTKKCEKIIPDPLCTKVEDIEMARVPVILPDGEIARFTLVSLSVGGQRLELDECEALAYADGFENFAEMMEFFGPRLPFKGKLIHWRVD